MKRVSRATDRNYVAERLRTYSQLREVLFRESFCGDVAMLIVVCSGCQSKLKVKPSLAGRRLKCPKCRNAVTIPAANDPADEVTLTLAPEGDPAEAPTPPGSTPPAEEETADAVSDGEAMPLLIPEPSSSATTRSRHRKRRSSAGIWLPLVLILIAIGGSAVWFLSPDKPPAMTTR